MVSVKRTRKTPHAASLRLAEAELSLRDRFMRVFSQPLSWWGVEIGGVCALALIGIALLISFWGGRQAKGVKELQEGIRLLQGGEIPRAASQLELAERYLAGGDEVYLAQLARFKLGTLEEKKGNFAEARVRYETSAEMEGPLKAESLLAIARVLSLLKDESSTSYYQKFLEQYPDSPMSALVREKIEKG